MTFAVTATAVAIGSTAASIYSGEKSRSAQKQASKKQERQARLQNARDAMSQVRQQRIAQAQITQGAATQGTQSSSAAQGGYSAVGSLTSGNMQFINQMDSISSQISELMQRSQRYQGQAQMYNSAANLAMQGASFTGGSGGTGEVAGVSVASSGVGAKGGSSVPRFGGGL
jgi:hypothetical protein